MLHVIIICEWENTHIPMYLYGIESRDHKGIKLKDLRKKVSATQSDVLTLKFETFETQTSEKRRLKPPKVWNAFYSDTCVADISGPRIQAFHSQVVGSIPVDVIPRVTPLLLRTVYISLFMRQNENEHIPTWMKVFSRWWQGSVSVLFLLFAAWNDQNEFKFDKSPAFRTRLQPPQV